MTCVKIFADSSGSWLGFKNCKQILSTSFLALSSCIEMLLVSFLLEFPLPVLSFRGIDCIFVGFL